MRIIITTLTLLFVTFAWATDSDKAIETFLKQVDNKSFAKTWDNASPYFQKAITKEQWLKSLEAVRLPLGIAVKRSQKSKTEKNSLPGAPDGHYFIYIFETSFSNKKSATETITVHEEKDKSWKLVGYYIK